MPRQQAFEDALDGAAQAYFDLGDAQQVHRAVAQPFQVHIVDADDFAAMNVDDLAVDQVLLQEEIVLVAVKRAGGPMASAVRGCPRGFHDLVGGNDLQSLAGLEHQAGDAPGFCSGGYGDIFEAAAHVALASVTGVPSMAVRLTRDVVRGRIAG
jgi:hypothetical protein